MAYLFKNHVTAIILLTTSTSLATSLGKPSVGRLARDLLPFHCDVDASDHSGLVDGISCEWDWWAHSGFDFEPQPFGGPESRSSSTSFFGRDFDNSCDDIPLSRETVLTKCEFASKQGKSDVVAKRPELETQSHFCQPSRQGSSLCMYTDSPELGSFLKDMKSSCHQVEGEAFDEKACRETSLAFVSYLSQKFNLFGNRYTFTSPEEKAAFIAEHPECSSMDCHGSPFSFEVCDCNCDCGCDADTDEDTDEDIHEDTEADEGEGNSDIFARSESIGHTCGTHHFDSPAERHAWLTAHPSIHREDMNCLDLPLTDDMFCRVDCDAMANREKRGLFDAHLFESTADIDSFILRHPECATMPCTDGSAIGYQICYCDEDDDEDDYDNLLIPRSAGLPICDVERFDSPQEMDEWVAAHPTEAHNMTCFDVPLSNDLWCRVGCHFETMLPALSKRTGGCEQTHDIRCDYFDDGTLKHAICVFFGLADQEQYVSQHQQLRLAPQLCNFINAGPAFICAYDLFSPHSSTVSSASMPHATGGLFGFPKLTAAIPKFLDLDITITKTSTLTSTTFIARATGASIEARDPLDANLDSTLAIKTVWPESTSYITTTTKRTMEVIMPHHTAMGSTVVEVEQTSTSTSTTTMATPFNNGLTTTSVVWQTIYEPDVIPESTMTVWETVSAPTPEAMTTSWETVIAPEATPEPILACEGGSGCTCDDCESDDDEAACQDEEFVEQAPEQEPAGMVLGVPKEVTKSCMQQDEATTCFKESEDNLWVCGENDYACRCQALNQRVSCFDYCNVRSNQWKSARKLRSLYCSQASAFPPASPAKDESATQTIAESSTIADAPTTSPCTDSAFAILPPMVGAGLAAVFGVGAFLI